MPPESTERPPMDPDAVAQRAFSKGRKGYDTDEVRAFLVGLASEIRDLQRVHGDTVRRLAEVERRAADPRELDEESVTQLLGEETARVLVDARKAAAEIRAKAEEEASSLREAAAEEAAETRSAAEQYADSVRTRTDEAQAKVRADADAYAADLRETAERETTEQRSSADAYSAEVRETADREVAEQRATAQSEVDELTEKARSILAEKTAEAEEAAANIRANAATYDEQVRFSADAYAESTRTAADAYNDETRAAGETAKAEAMAEAERLRIEAQDAAAARAAEAAERYDARVAEAEAEAERIVDAAREKGRGMVQEARGYRERVITDLAERRRAARDELDRIAKTRDALAVTLTDVRTQIERSHRTLQEVVIDSTSVADGGADRRFLEVDESASGVAVGEIDEDVEEFDEIGGIDSEDAVDEAEGVSTDDAADTDPDDTTDDTDGDPGGDTDADSVDVPSGDAAADDTTDGVLDPGAFDEDDLDDEAPVWSDDEDPSDSDGVGGDDSDEDDDAASDGDAVTAESAVASGDSAADTEEASEGEGDAAGEEADAVSDDSEEAEAAPRTASGVDDLFARIRAEREASESAVEVEGDAPEGDTNEEPDGDDVVSGEGPLEDADAAGADAAGAEAGAEEEPAGDDRSPDVDLLELRDATTDEIERQLARRLKRVLSDEQNEALHNLRNLKGTPTADAVLPTAEDHLSRFREAVLEDLRAAERAGASFYSEAPERAADVVDIAEELSSDLVRQVRGRLERSFEGSEDPDDVADGIRTLYREWKTQRIAEAARHFVIAAFSRGVAEAAPDGASFRWLVDHGGEAAPDCDDNALAGAVAKGEPFPTGDLLPPVHPGCRCLAVPVD